MRELRKNKPEKVEEFLSSFKNNLDEAIKNKIQNSILQNLRRMIL
jgi:hypothetical protein